MNFTHTGHHTLNTTTIKILLTRLLIVTKYINMLTFSNRIKLKTLTENNYIYKTQNITKSMLLRQSHPRTT